MCKGFFNGPLAKFIPVKQVVFAEPLAKSLRGEPMAQRYIGCQWHLQSVFLESCHGLLLLLGLYA